MRDYLSTEQDRFLLGIRRIVGDATDLCMQVGAAERIRVDDLARCCLDQRWAAQEDSAVAAKHDDVVTERRNIGAACGALTENQRQLGHSHLREDRLISKDAARAVSIREEFALKGEKAAGAVADVYDRQAVLDGDVETTHVLLDRERIPSAALDARIIGADHDLSPTDDTDSSHDARALRVAVVFRTGCERRQLQERRSGIEERFDPLAHELFAVVSEAIEVALGTTMPRFVLTVMELAHTFQILLAEAREIGTSRVDSAFDTAHHFESSLAGASGSTVVSSSSRTRAAS